MTLLSPLRLRPTSNSDCPVREAASGAGRWITIGGDEEEGGGTHVFISGSGGTITKGPKSLLGGKLSHLSSSGHSITHHPPGHEPPGARSHPQYAEHQPPEKPAPLPGKPYARLHGGAQTRQEQPKEGPEPLTKEQTHAGLQTAREQAKAATAATPDAKAADAAVAHQQAQADLAAYRASKDRNPNPWAPHLSPPVNDARDKELAEKATRAQLAHQGVQAQQEAERAKGQGHTIQSVSADAEAHKAAILDEHPDLKAYLTHAEQHNAAVPKGRFEDRIDTQEHEKWLNTEARARLSPQQRAAVGIPERMAQTFPKPLVPRTSAPKPAVEALRAKPGEITKEHIQAKVMAGEHLTREEKGFVLNGYRMPKPKPEEPTDERRRTVRASAGPAPRFAAPARTAAR